MTTRTTLIGLIVIIFIAIVALVVAESRVPQQAAEAPIATASYLCDGGKTIAAQFYQGPAAPKPVPGEPPTPTGHADITLSDGRVMTLAQALSADGARYANSDESFVFWSKGNGALVLENNQEKSYIGCIALAPLSAGSDLTQSYATSTLGFSLRYPLGYTVDDSYRYQELGPGKDISGIKFTIPSAVASGTNLSTGSYVSVEEIPQATDCTASLFLDMQTVAAPRTIIDGGTTYSVASTTGAGAGNRYEETVYALPGTDPCIAVRYFIHYGVIENYPAGMVRQFDHAAFIKEFDATRRTLVIH